MHNLFGGVNDAQSVDRDIEIKNDVCLCVNMYMYMQMCALSCVSVVL